MQDQVEKESEKPEQKRFALTHAHIETLHQQITRTGMSIRNVFRYNLKCAPRYMSENIAQSWLRGQTKTATKENWHWLIGVYEELPNAEHSPVSLPPQRLKHFASIDDRNKVRAEFKRTGIGGRGIYRLLHSKPDGLKKTDCIQAVSYPQCRRRASHINAILKAYAALPDSAYEPFTQSLMDNLNAEIERTGLSTNAIIALVGDEAPADLNARMVYHWSAGMVKTAKLDYVRLVLERLKSAPDGTARKKPKKRPRSARSVREPMITKEQYAELWKLRKKSKISPHKLLGGRGDVPEGLTPTMINGWLFKKADAFSQEHFEYVVAAYLDTLKHPLDGN